uniref:N-acetyltransferase domain-containing protein n=1 Tax=Phaeomonas parva TaxID=124430 RepID=A0A7S1XR62_9STRA|mmetsp:Transcript_31487/g.99848  ORF Transcript_31487/g.99848 Transcript_31487/m.99848 type:complete len:266 (+) Transcript_31487:67-864(+)
MRRAWRSFFAGLGLACLGGPAGALGLRFGWGPRRLGQAGATLDKTGLARGVGVLSEGEDFTIGVASKEDIPQLTELLVSNFCNELILLSSDLNRVERMLATLPVGLINNYFDLTARTEVTLGLQSRLTSELPDLSARSCTRSVMLVARDKETQTDVLGAAELRLVQPNGKLPGNFQPRSQPKDGGAEPYICNVSVRPEMRRRGIASALMNVGEGLFFEEHGYEKIYLHVEKANDRAVGLYSRRGYKVPNTRASPRRSAPPTLTLL